MLEKRNRLTTVHFVTLAVLVAVIVVLFFIAGNAIVEASLLAAASFVAVRLVVSTAWVVLSRE